MSPPHSIADSKPHHIKGLLSAVPLALLVIGCIAAAIVGNSRGSVPADTKTQQYIVQPGDSLWSIASTQSQGYAVEAEEQWMDQVNHLNNGLTVGQIIIVPIKGSDK